MDSQPTAPVESKGQPSASSMLLCIGIVLTAIGIFSLAVPMVTAIAVEILVGISLLLAGIAQAAYAFQSRRHTDVIIDAICATLFIIAGFFMLAAPLQGVVTLAFVLAILFVAEGIGRLLIAFRLPSHFNRTLPLIEGVAGIIIGAIFWVNWPGDSAWMIGLLVGIRFLLAGLTFIMFGLAMRDLKQD